jgi:hypothetical protein
VAVGVAVAVEVDVGAVEVGATVGSGVAEAAGVAVTVPGVGPVDARR